MLSHFAKKEGFQILNLKKNTIGVLALDTITKYHRLGTLNIKHLFLIAVAAAKYKIKV